MERINVVFGDVERLSVKITNNGKTIKIYASRYPFAADEETVDTASIHPIWAMEE